MCFEVVDFVPTTRRRHDRGNPRDAGDWYACQSTNLQRGAAKRGPFIFKPRAEGRGEDLRRNDQNES